MESMALVLPPIGKGFFQFVIFFHPSLEHTDTNAEVGSYAQLGMTCSGESVCLCRYILWWILQKGHDELAKL